MQPQDKPIGYWLKHLDRLIEDRFERALADHGLVRRHWQVLNALRDAPATLEAIAEGPFWTEGPARPEEVLGRLVQRGWINRKDEGRLFARLSSTVGFYARPHAPLSPSRWRPSATR